MSDSRLLGGAGWNVWRTIIGVVYLAAAVFNLAYTLLTSDSAGSLTAIPIVRGSCSSRAS
jgi:hypothetical protein